MIQSRDAFTAGFVSGSPAREIQGSAVRDRGSFQISTFWEYDSFNEAEPFPLVVNGQPGAQGQIYGADIIQYINNPGGGTTIQDGSSYFDGTWMLIAMANPSLPTTPKIAPLANNQYYQSGVGTAHGIDPFETGQDVLWTFGSDWGVVTGAAITAAYNASVPSNSSQPIPADLTAYNGIFLAAKFGAKQSNFTIRSVLPMAIGSYFIQSQLLYDWKTGYIMKSTSTPENDFAAGPTDTNGMTLPGAIPQNLLVSLDGQQTIDVGANALIQSNFAKGKPTDLSLVFGRKTAFYPMISFPPTSVYLNPSIPAAPTGFTYLRSYLASFNAGSVLLVFSE